MRVPSKPSKLHRPGTTPRPFINFGRRLTEAVHDAFPSEISQEKLGQIVGVSQCAMSSWMRGSKMPPITKGKQLAAKLGVCVEWLYTGIGPRHPAKDAEIEAIARHLWELSSEQRQIILHMIEMFREMNKDKYV